MFRYFGSKASTASVVADIALDGLKSATAADAFGGLGNIGAEFRKRGCKVTTCDLLSFPNAFQHVRVSCSRIPDFIFVKKHLGIKKKLDLVSYLNSQTSHDGWFLNEYAKTRGFFTMENGARIGGVWNKIREWKNLGLLNTDEEKFITASLLNSMDAVANTAGTYYAFLKDWDRKALKTFKFEWFDGIVKGPKGIAVKSDALSYLSGKSFEVLYLDPPYNSRDYSRYYHLPETLAKFSEIPIDPTSKSGQPSERPMEGAQIRDAMKLPYLLDLVEKVKWKRLVVQYAAGAHLSLDNLEEALSKAGTITTHKIPALGYQSINGSRQQMHHVFVIDN